MNPFLFSKHIHRFAGVFIGLLCLNLASCTDDTKELPLSKGISFIPVFQDSWQRQPTSAANKTQIQSSEEEARHTRSVPITNMDSYGSFSVSAFCYTGNWDELKTPNYIYNTPAAKSGTTYSLTPEYYWPGSAYKMKFFAHAPAAHPAFTLSGATQTGSPEIHATIPADVNQQKDLLVAVSNEQAGNGNTPVQLPFQHALTAIRFICGDNVSSGKIIQINLKNIYSDGYYNMGSKTWNRISTIRNFSQTINTNITGTTNESITSGAQTFMMIPQTLPATAQIEIIYEDQYGQAALTSDIGNDTWPGGKTVTYRIFLDDKIIIETNLGNFEDGGSL